MKAQVLERIGPVRSDSQPLRLVVNANRKEAADQTELLRLDYPRRLWLEKEIKSVANVTRQEVREFLAWAAEASLTPQARVYPLADANRALVELRTRSVVGAKVLLIKES